MRDRRGSVAMREEARRRDDDEGGGRGGWHRSVLVPTNNNGGGWSGGGTDGDANERKESVSVSCVLCGNIFFATYFLVCWF